MKKIAIVTGANRGIGYEIAKTLGQSGQYHVLVGSRSIAKGDQAVVRLRAEGAHDVECWELDTNSEASIHAAFARIAERFGRLDVLVNNAGVFLDSYDSEGSLETPGQLVSDTFQTNVLGPFLTSQEAVLLMRKHHYGRIVNISSGMGQLSEMNGSFPAYRISKTALNAVTRIFSDETQGENILVNSACPGWVKTDMGGPSAERTVAQGAATPLWLAQLPEGGPTGSFFRDQERIDW